MTQDSLGVYPASTKNRITIFARTPAAKRLVCSTVTDPFYFGGTKVIVAERWRLPLLRAAKKKGISYDAPSMLPMFETDYSPFSPVI